MFKVFNGVIMDMTQEEIEELQQMNEQYELQEPTKTNEERIGELEQQLNEQIEINIAQDETIIEIFENL